MAERYDLVISTAAEIDMRCVGATPFNVAALCNKCGVPTMPLSYFLEMGATREGFFAVCGNEDGAAICYRGIPKILYNDEKPRRRVRFTLMEELSHVALRHVFDGRFDICREMDEVLYAQYENEAKNCAGLLLMNPILYYRLRRNFTLAQIAGVFDISVEAAFLSARFADAHEDEIRAAYSPFVPRCDLSRLVSFKTPKRAILI